MATYLDSQTLLVRSLSGRGKAIAVLLAIIVSNKSMISEEDIAGILGCSPKTARTGLNVLNTMGLITRTHFHSGWTLTEGGRQLFLQSPQLRLQEPTNEDPDTGILDLEQPGKNYRVNPQNVQPGKNYRVSPQNVLRDDSDVGDVVDDLSNLKDLKTTTTTTETVEIGKNQLYETALRICTAVEVIWGSTIWPNVAERVAQNELRKRRGCNAHLPGIPDLIGWIAHCHHNPNRVIKDPAAVVAADILGCRRPGKKYRENPEAYLPVEYLQAAGLERLIPDDQPTLIVIDEPEDEPVDEIISPDIDGSVLQTVSGSITAQVAWERAIEDLRRDMPPNAWSTWIKPAWLQAWDGDSFIVAVPNAYNRDWLESRLSSTLVRSLTGICNRSVRIRFEVRNI